MNKLLKRLPFANTTQRQSAVKRCNYKNNYYGDQVCISVSEKKPV
ncbi:hypothetical protein [Alteromonas sp. KUL49]|nr:hypothetical protein [Alteromonas sp. KUL49]